MRKLHIALLAIITISFLCAYIEKSEKVRTAEDLGKKLFFDPILSNDSSISCASCHKPEFAFADNIPFSFGVDSLIGTRNTPSAMNVSSRASLFWDGRASTLEQQALMPIENPIEMNLRIDEAIRRLNRNQVYKSYFNKVFNSNPSAESLGKALAAFERTLETANSPFDQFSNGEKSAISESAKRGNIIFNEKGRCFDCHFGPDFTGDEFRNIALFNNRELNDRGRFDVSKDSSDLGKFKVPSLRNVSITAPYMHNGMFNNLNEVVSYYNDPEKFVHGGLNRDSLLVKPLGLTEQEKQDLVAFLITLTDQRFLKKK